MGIKVNFTDGSPTASASGLYQWDYGQILEIECAELGSEIMEVHFACRGMNEAIVRSCSFSNGVGTVTIPDQCLEQTEPITAWIYSVSGTQGHTVKAITLPIIARTRPSVSRDVPMEHINLYGEALNEINEAINNLENGNITAAKATHANIADMANTATNAGSASYATSAGSATNATNAEKANELNFRFVGSATITNGDTATEADRLPRDVLKADCVYLAKFYPSVAVGVVDAYTSVFTFNPGATFTSVLLDSNLKADICGDDNCGHVEMVKIPDGAKYWSTATEVNGIFSVYKVGTFTT